MKKYIDISRLDLSDIDSKGELIDTLEYYLEMEGYNILKNDEDPNDRFLNQSGADYVDSEWFGFHRLEPEYDSRYTTVKQCIKVNNIEAFITIYSDKFGNECIKIE